MADSVDEPRWLTERQQEIWRSWLLGVARIQDYLNDQLHDEGLDLAEYEVLVSLSEAPNRMLRMSELAKRVHQSRSRLTHTAARLEQRGYLKRHACPEDKRGVLAQLTDEGFALLEQAAPGHVAAVRNIFVDAVNPRDFEAIGRAMQAVMAAAV